MLFINLVDDEEDMDGASSSVSSPSSSSSINYSIYSFITICIIINIFCFKKNYIYERREDDKGRLVFLVGEGNQENDLIFGIRQIYNDHEHFNKAKKFDVLGPNTFVIGYQKIKNRSFWLLSKKGINQAKKKALLAIASSPSASSSISSVSKKNYIYERREDDKGRLVF